MSLSGALAGEKLPSDDASQRELYRKVQEKGIGLFLRNGCEYSTGDRFERPAQRTQQFRSPMRPQLRTMQATFGGRIPVFRSAAFV